MSYTIEIEKEIEIIKYRVFGSIEKSDIGFGWEAVINTKEFSELEYYVLADYSKAEFNFSIADTGVLDEIIDASKQTLIGKKTAVVVNIPRSTAITMLVKEKFDANLGHSVKIFSTEDGAMKWLLE